MRVPFLVMLLGIGLLNGCTPQGDSNAASAAVVTASDRAAVQQLFDRYLVAFRTEDLEALRSMYTDDALLLGPGSSVVKGVDAIISEWYRPMFEAFDVEMELPSEELQVDTEWGFNRGPYAFWLTPQGGGEVIEERGKYLDVVRKGPDGSWRIARAIWNTDVP